MKTLCEKVNVAANTGSTSEDDRVEVNECDSLRMDTVVNVKIMSGMRDDARRNVECTFKRGGKCNIHGIRGTKHTVVKQTWTKLKGGLFGYKNMSKTTYSCSMRNVPMEKPIRLDSPSMEKTEVTSISKEELGEGLTTGQGYILSDVGISCEGLSPKTSAITEKDEDWD